MAGNAENAVGRRWSRLRIAAWSAPVVVLLIPLVAMQFTDEVNWTLSDFVIMGALMLSVGVAYELAVRMTSNIAYRVAVGLALAAAFLLVWVNGAVGIIGSENNDVNLLYFGVLAIGMIGAVVALFQPLGMSRALLAMAVAQMLVPVIALVWKQPPMDPGVAKVFVLNGFFAMLFVGSALLFRKAASEWTERRAA